MILSSQLKTIYVKVLQNLGIPVLYLKRKLSTVNVVFQEKATDLISFTMLLPNT